MSPYEEDLMHRWTMREIRMIEERQREIRWRWRMARLRRELPVVILALLGAVAVGLAVLLGVN